MFQNNDKEDKIGFCINSLTESIFEMEESLCLNRKNYYLSVLLL